MALHSDRTLDGLIRKIVEAVCPQTIILFGSRARSENASNSDVDLLIIEDNDFGPKRSRRKETSKLWRTLADIDIPKDILVFSRQEVENWKNSSSHVIARALKEGKVLYERD